MKSIGASITFNNEQRGEQERFVRDRAEVIQVFGDQVWANITPEQAETFRQQGIEVQFHEQAYLVELPGILFDPVEGEPQPPADFAFNEPPDGETTYYLVQFQAPPDQDWIAALEETGATYVSDAPQQVGLFRMTTDEAASVREQEFVRWVGIYHPLYALDFVLAGRETPFSAADLSGVHLNATKYVEGETVTLQVKFFADRTTEEMIPKVEQAGATVDTDTGYNLIVVAPPENIINILRIPGVSAVEPYIEPKITNQRAGVLIGANQVRNFGNVDFLVNLDGDGEIVGVMDTGLDNGANPPAHRDFFLDNTNVSRVLKISNINSPKPPQPPIIASDHSPHGTHVTGSIAGNGNAAIAAVAANPNPNPDATIPRGIAPRARIIFHSVNKKPPAPNAVPPLSFRNYVKALKEAYEGGARVHNNSWANQNQNRYSQSNSEVLDAFAFTHPDMLILFAAGNDEDDANNTGVLDMTTLGEYAVAKNILCIGACENETDKDGNYRTYRGYYSQYTHKNFDAVAKPKPDKFFSMSDSADDIVLFSNRGRVVDFAAPGTGRVRPDLVAPGTNIMSTRPDKANKLDDPFKDPTPGPPMPPPSDKPLEYRIPKTAPADFYYVDSGTSMATPLASGASLLVRQFYRTRFASLRRPLLVEALRQVKPTDPPPPVNDLPTASTHATGCVLAWIRPVASPASNNIVAARFNRGLVRVGDVKELFTNVGDAPAITVASRGDTTFLVHRAQNGIVNLSLYDKDLVAVGAFGTAGTVALSTASAPENERRPTLCVNGDEVAVSWVKKDTDELLFQRFRADKGTPIDANPKTLGKCTATSSHPFLVQTGARYAAAWVRFSSNKYELLFRTVDSAGKVEGTKPTALVEAQTLEIRDAHLAWDARQKQYVVAWVGVDANNKQNIFVQRAAEDGTKSGAAVAVLTVDVNQIIRRPRIAPHPDKGYVLLWEDNTQTTHDLYLTFLDKDGNPDTARMPAGRLQISDTPKDTSGFSALVDADGVLPFWQSNDEINSDLLGVYALKVTREGAFQSELDPNTPLLQHGRYVAHLLFEHGDKALFHTALAWTGGEQYMLRLTPGAAAATVNLQLVRTNADGKPHGIGGAVATRSLHTATIYNAISMHWTGNNIVAACSTDVSSHLFLLDGEGQNVQTFGTFGRVELTETPAPDVAIQVGQRTEKKDSRIFVLYGQRNQAAPHNLRYAVMTEEGKTTGKGTVAPRNLANGDKTPVLADGTARRGSFHVLKTDAPVHFIAAWHRRVPDANGKMSILWNRFKLDGEAQSGVPQPLTVTGLAGESMNACIAPRPVLFNLSPPTPSDAAKKSNQREFGLAWQHRAADASPWEIRFIRLQRSGKIRETKKDTPMKDVPLLAKAGEHYTHPQLVWHTDGYGLAWLAQDSTNNAANHRLFFTVVDENGARVSLPSIGGVGAPFTVSDFQISGDDADVQSFQLVWNGRTFRLAWTEIAGGKLRQRQMGLVVPRLAGGIPFNEPFQQPSAALVRATLINGATNIRNTRLPNIGTDPNDGYGWGRINLRQSLSPVPPVTFHVRDDAAVEKGRTARYQFSLPPQTSLLRITLVWTDPPRRTIVNNLNLRVTAPASAQGASRIYVGNRWQTGALTGNPPVSGPPFSDPLPDNLDPKIDPFEKTHTIEQVVIPNPPAGDYLVEVIGGAFLESMYMQHAGQPFALVFVGSGPEIRTARRLSAAAPAEKPSVY
ncbi:MAG TPA: S8 family serine peptidase [Pyrinomonadaceae bacterium]|jgi:hypothetical protein